MRPTIERKDDVNQNSSNRWSCSVVVAETTDATEDIRRTDEGDLLSVRARLDHIINLKHERRGPRDTSCRAHGILLTP